ncbi:hypothetical protein [Candidatus Aquicultor sp.]
MRLGYTILAEAFIRDGNIDEALKAVEYLEGDRNKRILLREIRNIAIRQGRLDAYHKTSEAIGLDSRNPDELTTMLLANIEKQIIDGMNEIIDLLPDGKTKNKLLTTAILESAYRGHIVICEQLAEKRGSRLTRDEAMTAKIACVTQGWISDAQRAAKAAGIELSKEDYRIMFVANKDKGLLSETIEMAKLAGEELTADIWSALLLAAASNGKANVWVIAEKF